jgi:hypothetical protein
MKLLGIYIAILEFSIIFTQIHVAYGLTKLEKVSNIKAISSRLTNPEIVVKAKTIIVKIQGTIVN